MLLLNKTQSRGTKKMGVNDQQQYLNPSKDFIERELIQLDSVKTFVRLLTVL